MFLELALALLEDGAALHGEGSVGAENGRAVEGD